jgi:hypothetical protein
MTMPDREFRNDAVRISDLTINTIVLDGYTFSNCRILGPIVLVPQGQTGFVNCNFGSGVDEIFWEIPPSRQKVVGAVAVRDCMFSGCTFDGVGLAGPQEFRDKMLASANG